MRSFIIAILFASACAHTSTGPQPINVASVRNEIKASINAEPTTARSIASMGKVTETTAVVYTQSPSGEKHEETWSKDGGAWKLQTTTAVTETARAR